MGIVDTQPKVEEDLTTILEVLAASVNQQIMMVLKFEVHLVILLKSLPTVFFLNQIKLSFHLLHYLFFRIHGKNVEVYKYNRH